MKYIEAMIGEPSLSVIQINTESVNAKMRALRKQLAAQPGEADPADPIAFELFEDADESVDDIIGAAQDVIDEGPPFEVPSLIPVSSSETINVQMGRAGFLNGEVVVILRESDFLRMRDDAQAYTRALIAMTEES